MYTKRQYFYTFLKCRKFMGVFEHMEKEMKDYTGINIALLTMSPLVVATLTDTYMVATKQDYHYFVSPAILAGLWLSTVGLAYNVYYTKFKFKDRYDQLVARERLALDFNLLQPMRENAPPPDYETSQIINDYYPSTHIDNAEERDILIDEHSV